MNKFMQTFWKDNRTFISIFFIAYSAVILLFPSAIILITKLYTTSSTYFSLDNKIMLVYGIIASITLSLVGSLVTTGIAIFISARTHLGKSRIRYSLISTTKVNQMIASLLNFLALVITAYIVAIFILFIIGIFSGIDISEFLSIIFGEDGILSKNFTKMIFGISAGAIFLNQFISILSIFIFWQLLFVLPQTKMLNRFPKVGSVFIMIGGYLTLLILRWIVSFQLIISASIKYSIWVTLTMFIVECSIYVYTMLKEYEI